METLQSESFVDNTKSLAVTSIPGKGRGVFATKAFGEGDVIERALTWEIDGAEIGLIDQTRGLEYYFIEPTCHAGDIRGAGHLVFGIVSLVNHSDEPNAKISWEKSSVGAIVSLIATKAIQVGEEITHRYVYIEEYRLRGLI